MHLTQCFGDDERFRQVEALCEADDIMHIMVRLRRFERIES